MYVKKIDLLIFGFPSLFSFVFCPAAGWRSPSTLLLCTASILEVWSLNPQILKPQPSNFEASTVKFWSLNRQNLKPQSWKFWSPKPQPSNFEASSLNPENFEASSLKFWSLKPQPSNFEASSLKFWELKPQSSIFEASSLQFWSLNRQILKPQAPNFEASSSQVFGRHPLQQPALKDFKVSNVSSGAFSFPFGRRPP